MTELTGLRVYGADSFREAFSPLFGSFDGLYFREPQNDSCIRFPFDDDSVHERYRNSALHEAVNGDLLFRSQTLIKFADIIDEDWNAIDLLDTTDFKLHRKFERQRLQLREDEASQILDQRIVFFHNFDGCFWQFFTNINGLAQMVVNNHRTTMRIDLRYVNICEHYWNVGSLRKDYPTPVQSRVEG